MDANPHMPSNSNLDQNDRQRLVALGGKVASVGLAIGGALSLLVLSRVLYIALTGQRQFTSPLAIAAYYGLPALAAIVLFASALKLNALQKLRLLISCITVLGSVYAAELFLTLVKKDERPQPAMLSVAKARNKAAYAEQLSKQFGNAIDIRGPSEVIDDLKRDGTDVIPIVTPSNHLFIRQSDGSIRSPISIDGREVMPLSSVSMIRTLVCNEDGRWIDFKTDEHGFNNDGQVWQLDRLDVVALGDSFAHGYCVPRDKNFVELIRRQRPATLNLGMAGDGPLLMLATLDEYLPRLRPRTVLWFYFEGNDLTDLQDERKSALLNRYLTGPFTQPDLARQADIDQALRDELPRLEAAEREAAANRTRNTIRGLVTSVAKLSSIRQRLGIIGETDVNQIAIGEDLRTTNMDVFRATLIQSKARVAGWGGRLYFVYLPEWARYTSYGSWGQSKRDHVIQLVRDLGIPIIDLDPPFRATGDPLSLFPFRAQSHYSEAGHRLVADEVLRALQKTADGSP
jgi:hypothetical protein